MTQLLDPVGRTAASPERPVLTPAARTARRKALLHWIAVHSLGIAAALFFVLPFVFV
ncbi:carbohydrate ABC transporter permease, partial [Streptomyces griseus]